MPKGELLDLVGQRFGKLVIKQRLESVVEACGTIRAVWLAICDCGKTVNAKTRYLRRGTQKSCKVCRYKAPRARS